MKPVERRLINELVAMYKLEPTIRDVFVEGPFDRSLVDWFLSEGGAEDVSVHEIDSVHVPADLVETAGFAQNNRGRLLALAREIQSDMVAGTSSISCVVDADFDHVLNTTYELRCLLVTDYSSMELYFFDVGIIEKFLKLGLQGFPKPAKKVLDEIQSPLIELFAIRLANHVLGWPVGLVSFERCCKLTDNGVELDRIKYVDRCLNAAGKYSEKAEFNRVLSDRRGQLAGDPRTFIHGHDFMAMLVWYIRQYKPYKVSQGSLERAIVTCAEFRALRTEPLFATLLNRFLTAG
jgi:hypothetical protein